jgi:D-3-phosphoglycerate dehydrogenase
MTDTLPTVLLTNAIHPDGEAILAPHARLVLAPDTKPDTLRSLAADATGIVVRAKLPDDIADGAPKLKGIVRHGVGLDFIPVEAATRRGIAVANLPGCNTQSVVEYVLSAIFHLRRPLYRLDAGLRAEGWLKTRPLADTLAEVGGSTLGILGVGTIGGLLAQRARLGLGMRVIGTSRRKGHLPEGVEEVEIDRLFTEADVVALTCALTDETRGIVNGARIGSMKNDAILINVSRGPVVETAALVEALEAGRLGGAALDVFDTQPLPSRDPLFSCPNLLLTPHSAALTATSGRVMSVGAAEEMVRILRCEDPKNLVNPDHKRA